MEAIWIHRILMTAVMAVVVLLLRAFPFLFFRNTDKPVPPLLTYLGTVMTAAAIAMLVAYSFIGLCDFSDPHYIKLAYGAVASVVTVVLHLLMKNSLVSIIGGTAVYMAFINLM